MKEFFRKFDYQARKWLSRHFNSVKDPDRSQRHWLINSWHINNTGHMKNIYPHLQKYREKYHPKQFYDDEIPDNIFFFLCNFLDHSDVSYKVRPPTDEYNGVLNIKHNKFPEIPRSYLFEDTTELIEWMLFYIELHWR